VWNGAELLNGEKEYPQKKKVNLLAVSKVQRPLKSKLISQFISFYYEYVSLEVMNKLLFKKRTKFTFRSIQNLAQRFL